MAYPHLTSAFVPGKGHQLIGVCCTAFADAMQSGTDNEGYAELIYIVSYDGDTLTWVMGTQLPEPAYCPWCGSSAGIKMAQSRPAP